MKSNNTFILPYIGSEVEDGIPVFYTKNGEYSVIFNIRNFVLEYSADPDYYSEYHRAITNIIEVLGSDYTVQKHDIFSKKSYVSDKGTDFLDKKYFEHFKGREYQDIQTYITITKNIKKSNFYTFNKKDFSAFIRNAKKIFSILKNKSFRPSFLSPVQIDKLISRFLAFNFSTNSYSLNNFKANDEYLEIGGKCIKSISLVDIDEVNMPEQLSPTANINLGYMFPVDLMGFLKNIPGTDSLIYSQVIIIPDQRDELKKLDGKKRKHQSMPDPANDLAVQDIDIVLSEIAKTNKLLVYSHFNIMFATNKSEVERVSNHIDSELFKIGIKPNGNAYNQMEMFRASLPGNTSELKHYDQFLSTSEASICLFFKESLVEDDDSEFQIYFASRQGIPVAIDPADLPMANNRINNRNKFVLGPSGSGKSFFMNHMIRQYYKHNFDIVLVDTGHSYEGLCNYYGGKYITYSEETPITFNPFRIDKEEYNEEKREFLKSLISLLWKGSNGTITQVEDRILSTTIQSYYTDYFEGKISREDLSFNSFYEYSIICIKDICTKESIEINISDYSYLLARFYKTGEFPDTLNSDMDRSLFDETFIVFEIDAIKEHKLLFPITTLIIMDVFLQKMRLKNTRKALIIEEAWKAIASPLMASYILYLYKTVRKFRGEAVVVTQELDDIIGNAIVKNSIVNNSDTICMLDQSKFKDNFEDIAALLSINERERKKIFTINNLDNKDGRGRFKEVYIRRGSEGEVYGVEVSLFEYLTYTTERTEKEALRVYVKLHNNYEYAITAFIEDFYKSGKNLTSFCYSVLNNQSKLMSV